MKNKTMKKILAVALVLMMTLPLVAFSASADAYEDSQNGDYYEYPLETIVPVQGTIAYADDHVYKDEAKTKYAFIDLEELSDFDTVSFEVTYDYNDPWVCFAFLTEKPELGDTVKYAEGYSTFKFACYDCKADIPENAKYLAFYYSYDTTSYLPASITFTKGKTILENLQNATLEEYDLPMEYLVGDHAVIRYFDYLDGKVKKPADHKFVYQKANGDECKVAFVDITDTVFDRVILTPGADRDPWMGYTFLTEMPEIGEVVSYADGYDTVKEYDGEFEIPEGAKYLVVYYMDNYTDLYYPGAIKFVHVHEFVYDETVEATCIAGGYELWKCECEAEEKRNETGATGHSYGEWVVTKAATCTEAGVKEKTCSCGDKVTEALAATGHTYGEWVVTKAATCTEAGVKEKTCSCGDKVTEALAATGHSYGEWTETKAPTCTEAGVKEKTCSCGDKVTEALAATGHTYGEWVVTKAATFTEAGVKEKTCSCGDKVTETIPKLTPAPDDGTNSADDPFDDGYTPETKAPETSAPETNAPETEPAAKKGCGASLAMTGVALVGACAAMLAVKRRKNEDD